MSRIHIDQVWSNFAEANSVATGDGPIFTYIASSVMEIPISGIFSSNGCEREISHIE